MSSLPPSPPQDPAHAYRALITARKIAEDAAQASVVQCLQGLYESLAHPPRRALLRKAPQPPRSLYIWGNVGRGKSMLMDLFFNAVPVAEKRRVHFHKFMQETHAAIHRIRQTGQGDPVALYAAEVARATRLLCFDELQATDVADASILHRLFEGLFGGGVVIVSTSNHPPANLYTGGVQRERFQKFIGLLNEKMDIISLTSPHDYRTRQLRSLTRTWFTPLGRDADLFVEDTLARLTPGSSPRPTALTVQGRLVPLTAYGDSVALASFTQLCEAALGPADYLALAAAFETLVLTGIPVLTPEKRNEAKRFVTLIDALYESKVKLVATATAVPEALYPEGDGSFEFKRTVSRLAEMQSAAYLER